MPINLSAVFGMPPEEAVKWFEQKGYAITWQWQELWQEAQARAFTVAGVTRLEILNDIRSGLADALKNGKTLEQFINELTPLLQRKGWWGRDAQVNKETGEISGKGLTSARLKLIYQQNMQTAFMAGRYKAMQAAVVTHPNWQYVAVMDNRTRPAHAAINGRVFRADDPIWNSIYPPNGFRCRCRVRPMTDGAVSREDLTVTDSAPYTDSKEVSLSPRNPDAAMVKVTTFKTPDMPHAFSPDAGFNYNAGRSGFQPELDRYQPTVARQYVQGVLTGPEFRQTYARIQSAATVRIAADANPDLVKIRQELQPRMVGGQRFPVGILDDDHRDLLGSKTRVVQLSDETLLKQLINRTGQDIGLADYWRVQDVLQAATTIILDGATHLLFFKSMEKTYVAVVKSTTDGKELFLQSFRLSDEKDLMKLKRKGKVLKE